MANSFSVVQKAFIVNHRWQALILKRTHPNSKYDIWDLPGGPLDFGHSLRDSLGKLVRHDCSLNLTIISIPLNIASYIQNGGQSVRVIYLCRAAGPVSLNSNHSDHLWIDPVDHQHFAFPDVGYHSAFSNYLSHSSIASVEFLGPGLISTTIEPIG
ncbi:hypothetical protein HYS82_03180 [Candidatus Amesbacteria bacterium]|nr:hypothetical protein [Candidatus Amesbacteria bacterium]MBI2587271.1 hypothetical protein [Candidatus Amesbacteria bacterium]